jgi:hypothetical protein
MKKQLTGKSSRLIEAEDISLDEISDNWVSVGLGAEKFVIDMDTLYDLSFRFAAFLAFLESKQEEKMAQAEGDDTQCLCQVSADHKLH